MGIFQNVLCSSVILELLLDYYSIYKKKILAFIFIFSVLILGSVIVYFFLFV